MKIGNEILDSTGVVGTASTLIYSDSSGKLAQGNIPFAVPLHAGVTDTSYSALDIKGSSTLTANDIMHQTLVAGAGVTTFTKTGFIRVTITDSAGNITDGAHYIQIGTLS
jgi:hypothetical protein